MIWSGHTPDERPTSRGPHIGYVAVALVAAVTVLAGFSYATSTMVESLVHHESGDVTSSLTPARVTTALSASDEGRRASGAPRVPLYRTLVDMDDAGFGVLRVSVPVGRPLEIQFEASGHYVPIEFDTLKAVVREGPEGEVVCLPPLNPGAYPFSTRSGEQGGVLIAE